MVWWSKRKPLWEHTASGISTAGRGDHSPAGSRVIASIIDSRRYAGPACQRRYPVGEEDSPAGVLVV